ncbi:hypothetical protein [Hyphomicrobium sp. 99]|uniref:hypothetical protein n=1 Tax=Hyphomicrobium sp. 99 TaxID=1163419 RepID=UPI0006976778|nr:hypothetical protein [Hyphomicrobium sp. 99]
MFDCALHFRFLQKATEAMFEMGQASVAAALACQKRLYDEMAPEHQSVPESPAWPSWFGDWTPVAKGPAPVQAEIMQAWLAMASASLAYWPGAQQSVTASRVFPGGDSFWPASVQAFWGTTPWSLYQGPMMAMMLSYGIPYAVAAPTARASTSAMDAADAACTQWRLVFGNAEGRRVMDRHFPQQSPWSAYLH